MADQLWMDYGDDQLQLEAENHPGCVWNIFSSLDYHQWRHNAKKILHNKKNNGQKHAKCNRRTKTKLSPYNSQEAEKLLEGESNLLQAEQSSPKTSTTHKRSFKARIKALVSEENYKEKLHEPRGSNFRPRLQRTFSIHHLEPSDDRLSKVSRKWAHPIIFLPKNRNSVSKIHDLVSHTPKNDAYNNGNCTQDKCEKVSGVCVNQLEDDYASVLEIYKVNKDLFQNYIQKGDITGNGQRELKSNARLMKSGSFPVADMSDRIHLKPSKLKHKQSESWSFKKGDVFFSDRSVPKVVASNSTKGLHTKLGLLRGNDQEGKFSRGPSHIQESSERNQETGFELDNEENQETAFSLSSIQEFENQESNEDNQECGSVSRASLGHFRRTSSLNESIEKYTRLFDYTYIDKAKLNISKSLKLTNEYECSSGGNKISFRKITSLPHLDMLEESNDSHFSGNYKNKSVCVDANKEIECVNNMEERGDISGKFEKAVRFEEALSDEVILPNMEGCRKEMDSQEELEKNSAEFRVSGDLKPICVDEKQLLKPEKELSSDYCSTICTDNFENDKNVPIIQTHDVEEDNTDFEYVKAILELSGFTDNGFDTMWHSSDQPLGPSVFEELEACWPHESECCYDHEHLFDFVNEVLVQIYEGSFPYYPKALSSGCKIRPMPPGIRLLEEVWRSIVVPMSVGPEAEMPLDCLVGQDFAKDDGWMNLQMESECVGLDIEDLIFNELLEEIMNS